VLQIDQGSLYPALHRLERRTWMEADWGTSENNRRAKYYQLTSLGRKHLAEERRLNVIPSGSEGSPVSLWWPE
jgi:PadR family transcriptional regulator, regulatory protein PadR